MSTPFDLKIFTPADLPADAAAVKQIETCIREGDGIQGVLCADHHKGYSMPIGGVVAYPDYISPSGVGYDIGCGNKAVATSLFYSDIRADLPRIMDEVARRISFGLGRPNNEPVDHPIFDRINEDAPTDPIRNLLGTARSQLGTVGGGNHYVDLFREQKTDRVWIGVHFGSRGFGHKVASGFLALAQGKAFDERAQEGEMDSPPVLFHVDSALGHMYIEAMTIAGEYAYAGRDTVVNKVLEILGNPGVFDSVHNHHNFAWREPVYGTDAWVIRKGATPLWPGQRGFVGASMAEDAVIIRAKGMDAMGGLTEAGDRALWSAPHGAGRIMSRTEAKGKERKRVTCNNCGHTQGPGEQSFKICPECMHSDISKVWIKEKEGKIDWKATKRDLKNRHIELRGGEADEAPGAYKRLPEVLAAHDSHIEIETVLTPIGVAMAGSGTYDPFKD